ncbi:hypothetical protein COE58_25800 [Bacillus cereus]|nr:hypothetical protein COE58_25800 [Bacillus cereus]
MSTQVRKQIRVGLSDLDDSYALGKKVNIFHRKSNTLHTFTVCDIMLARVAEKTRWVTEWLIHLK